MTQNEHEYITDLERQVTKLERRLFIAGTVCLLALLVSVFGFIQ